MKITHIENKPGVYLITNTANGKVYVGSSVNIRSRIRQHRNALLDARHPNKHLQSAWDKFGADVFEVSVLQVVSDGDIRLAEQEHIDRLKCYRNEIGYNLSSTTAHPTMSEEVRVRQSKARKGVKLSDEARRNMSKARKGIVFTAEALANMAAAHVGKKHTPETLVKMRKAQLGRTHSADTKAKMAEIAKKRKPVTQELKDKMAASQKGRKHSEETKKKIAAASVGNKGRNGMKDRPETLLKKSAARLGIPLSEEVKAKISASKKGKKIRRTAEHNAKIAAAHARRREAKLLGFPPA
jgi:group I intron endonuclease